jgi:hypothetical protein
MSCALVCTPLQPSLPPPLAAVAGARGHCCRLAVGLHSLFRLRLSVHPGPVTTHTLSNAWGQSTHLCGRAPATAAAAWGGGPVGPPSPFTAASPDPPERFTSKTHVSLNVGKAPRCGVARVKHPAPHMCFSRGCGRWEMRLENVEERGMPMVTCRRSGCFVELGLQNATPKPPEEHTGVAQRAAAAKSTDLNLPTRQIVSWRCCTRHCGPERSALVQKCITFEFRHQKMTAGNLA